MAHQSAISHKNKPEVAYVLRLYRLQQGMPQGRVSHAEHTS